MTESWCHVSFAVYRYNHFSARVKYLDAWLHNRTIGISGLNNQQNHNLSAQQSRHQALGTWIDKGIGIERF